MIEQSLFGIMENGREVYLYRITNQAGEYAELLSYGASLHRLCVMDRDGGLGDVVLGEESVDGFAGFCTEGVVVGRCANRIADARYEIGGRVYQLEPGRGGHCLHSGSSNYGQKHFKAIVNEEENRVTFLLEDDGACGFGCVVHASISYTWNDAHQLIIDYQLIPEGTTLLSPTNHSYFNLGCKDARDHILQINADRVALKSERGVPEGNVIEVRGTYLDFRTPRLIRDALKDMIPAKGRRSGFDDNYILNGTGFREIGNLVSVSSGRRMRVMTDMPGLVLFAASLPEPHQGKNGMIYDGYCFVCMETQYVSNAINCEAFQKPIFRKGEKMISRTMYEFSVLE